MIWDVGKTWPDGREQDSHALAASRGLYTVESAFWDNEGNGRTS